MDEWEERRTLSSISFEMEEHKRFSWVIWCFRRYWEDKEGNERKMKKRHKYAQKISLCSCICHVYVSKIRVRKAFTSSLRAMECFYRNLLQWNKNSHFCDKGNHLENTAKCSLQKNYFHLISRSTRLLCDGSEHYNAPHSTLQIFTADMTSSSSISSVVLSDKHFAFAPTKYFPYQRPNKKRGRRKYSKRFSDEFQAAFLLSNPQHCSNTQFFYLSHTKILWI